MSRKYLFADESGNFDFRDHTAFTNGPTRYFAVGTAMVDGEAAMQRLRRQMADLRHDLAWNGVRHDGAFHASTDKQAVRDAVIGVIKAADVHLDVTLLEKSKAQPQVRNSEAVFYKYAWFYHLRYLAPRYFQPDDELLIVSASLGNKKKKAAFQKAVDDVVTQCVHYRVKRRAVFWSCDSEPLLQVADYGTWAVMRQYEGGDRRPREELGSRVRHVYDLWERGRTHYYGPMARKP